MFLSIDFSGGYGYYENTGGNLLRGPTEESNNHFLHEAV